jgi:transcriptional regulator with AAA-type ATPase domain
MVQYAVVDTTITGISLGEDHDDDVRAAVPQLIVALHCDRPTASPSRHLLDDVDEVRFGRGEASCRRDGAILTVRLADPRMSSDHGRLIRERDGWVLDDPASKNGSVVNGRLTRRAVLADGDLIELGRTMCLFRVAPPVDGAADLDAASLDAPRAELATFVARLAHAFARLARIAPTPVPVLILGETGTGKEVIARALHAMSGRAGPFVAVNSGALPETLLEGELFGARKGAFSGAIADRPGLVRAADRGTLFLDEIAELRPHSQVAFLRVLQEHEVVALGDTRPTRVDVRFVAATHRDVADLIERGEFRRDLHARLNGHVLALPPLRHRREDLGLLIRALLATIDGGDRVRLSATAARLLFRYDWPGNVRELEKALSSAAALAGDEPIAPADLPAALRGAPGADGPAPAAATSPASDEAALRAQLVTLLQQHGGNVAAVARAMGKEPMQIRRWVRRFALELDAYRR